MDIYHLHLIDTRIDITELTDKLTALGIDDNIANDLRFCPHFVCGIMPDDSTWFADNINDGYYRHLKQTQNVIDCNTLDDLVDCIAEARGNIVIGKKTDKKSVGKPNALF